MVQLLQPFFTLLGAIVLLNEEVLWITEIAARIPMGYQHLSGLKNH